MPPTARFERISPSPGTRLTAPATTPSTRTMRLSPSAISGRNFCTTCGSRYVRLNNSTSEARFRPSEPIRNTDPPAKPWSGLITMSLCSARKWRVAPSDRVSIVGGMYCAKSSTQTFSGAFRTAAGSLTTSVSAWMRSSKWVAVM